MLKAVNNLTDSPVTLGGVKIESKEQRDVREENIKEDELKALSQDGVMVEIKYSEINVSKKEKREDAGKGNITMTFEHVAYPESLIKKDGTLNGKPALKAQIEELNEKYGDKILDDLEFMEKYPEANIEAHRVEVGE